MISLLAPWAWCSSEADSWVFTMMAYCVQGFSGRMRWPGSACSLSPSVARRGGSTSAITQLLEPQASCPSNSVTFWKGLWRWWKKRWLYVALSCISVEERCRVSVWFFTAVYHCILQICQLKSLINIPKAHKTIRTNGDIQGFSSLKQSVLHQQHHWTRGCIDGWISTNITLLFNHFDDTLFSDIHVTLNSLSVF